MARKFFFVLWLALLTVGFRGPLNSAEISADSGAIYIVGVIESGDDERFRAITTQQIRRHPETPIERVRVYSPGGNLAAAIKIGEQINNLQLDTWAPSVNPSSFERSCRIGNESITFDPATGAGDARCTCASACFFIWASGATREGDVLGVHRPAFEAKQFANMPPDKAKHEYEAVLSRSRSHLQEWGIPTAVVDEVFEVSSSDVRFLSPSVLRSLRRTAQFDEQIIARCGSVLTTDEFVSAAGALSYNKYALSDKKLELKPKWTAQEQAARLNLLASKVECQQRATREIRSKTNASYVAAAGQAAQLTAARKEPTDTKAEANSVLANVLKNSKIQNAILMNSANQADVISDFDATWSDGQVLGWLLVKWQDESKQAVVDWATNGQKSGCDGAFSRAIAEDTDTISRFSTSCTTADDVVQDHFVLVRRPRGGFYLFATLSDGKGSLEVAQKADDLIAQAISRTLATQLNR